MGVAPEKLSAMNCRIQVDGDASKGLTWKQACAKLGRRSFRHGPNQ